MATESMMRVFKVNDGSTIKSYPVRDQHINVAYGECSTAAATAAKAVTLTNDPGWKMIAGSVVSVKFTYAVPANATLNVASTGAKSIYIKNAAITANIIAAGDIVTFMYDGNKYDILAIDRIMSDINNKAEKSATVSTVTYDGTNKKFTKTINGTTTDIVSDSTLKTDMALNNVENKSSATIRGELTSSNVTTALGYTPANVASPALTGTPTAPTAAAGTNTTQIATTAFVNAAFQANDAMVFKGTIGSSGATVTALPNTHYQGWTYKVITAGTYAGKACEIGDMIICVTDGTAANNDHWTVVQSNIDGAVTGPASSTADHIATFNGTTGKVIKDSGFTIGKSVPSNAVFTDTDTKVTSSANHYAPSTASGSDVSASASGASAAWSIDVVKGVTLNTDGKGHVTGMSVTSGKIPANPNTDTKVTSAANHYTPSRDTSADKSASASGATAAWSIDVVKGVTVQTDGKGHVTGVAVTSGKIPSNPNTNTTYSLTQDATDGHKITLTPSSGTAQTITIPDTNTWRPVSDSVSSTSSSDAASSKAVKTAYDLAASKTSNTGTVTSVATGAGLTGGTITTTGTLKANLTSETYLTNAAADGTETSGRVYPVRLDKNGKLAVNVPWTDHTYTIPTKVSQLTNDSGFTTNTGTITGIKMNGASKGTSGVVDLGTVITAHQDISGKANLASPALTGTPTAPTAAAGTNTTQIATTAFVNAAFQANDAMVFKGTIGSSGATVTALPTTHYQGWTYKVITAGTYAGKACEIGDMIICVTDGTAANDGHWTVVQSNIDGAVTGPASATDNAVAIFNGTTGKVIKNSGLTIGKSVPSNAVFTDTDTKVTSAANHYTPSRDTSADKSASASGATAAWSIDVVKGVTVQTDGKGHVTGVAVTSGKIPSNPNTNTTYSLTQDATDGHKITLTPSSGTAQTITIPDTNTWRPVSDSVSSTSSSDAASSKAVKTAYDLAASKTSNTGTITGIKMNGASKGTSGVVDLGTVITAHQDISGKKNTQSAVSDPSASGTSLTFISSISQNAQGVISPAKKTVSTMGAATSSAAGTAGLVPAPAAGKNTSYLRGDGTWSLPANAQLFVVDLDTVTNTTGSYNHSTTISGVTSDMKAIQIECSNPEVFKSKITITTETNAITLACGSVEGTSTVKVSLLYYGNGNPLNSTEYSALDTRINGIIPIKANAPIAIPNVGVSVSYNMTGITADAQLLRWNFSESAENSPPSSLTLTTYSGYFTITNNGGASTETVQPSFIVPTSRAATLRT